MRFFYKDEIDFRNITDEENKNIEEGKHTTVFEQSNDHRLIIFGTSLLALAALVFIAKNRETAKNGF